MQSQSLTESAAIVAIVKQFFDGENGSEGVANQELDEATAPLKAQMASLSAAFGSFRIGFRVKSAIPRQLEERPMSMVHHPYYLPKTLPSWLEG